MEIIILVAAIIGLAIHSVVLLQRVRAREKELAANTSYLEAEISKATQERSQLREEIDELGAVCGSSKTAEAAANATIDELRRELESASRELAAAQKATESAKGEVERAKLEAASAREDAAKSRSEVSVAQSDARAAEREARAAEREIGVARREAARLAARLDSAAKTSLPVYEPVQKLTIKPPTNNKYAPPPISRKVEAPSGAHIYDSKDFGKF